MNKVVLYRDTAAKFRWRFVAGSNGKVMADSGQGYTRKVKAVQAAMTVLGIDDVSLSGEVWYRSFDDDGRHVEFRDES